MVEELLGALGAIKQDTVWPEYLHLLMVTNAVAKNINLQEKQTGCEALC